MGPPVSSHIDPIPLRMANPLTKQPELQKLTDVSKRSAFIDR